MENQTMEIKKTDCVLNALLLKFETHIRQKTQNEFVFNEFVFNGMEPKMIFDKCTTQSDGLEYNTEWLLTPTQWVINATKWWIPLFKKYKIKNIQKYKLKNIRHPRIIITTISTIEYYKAWRKRVWM